MSCFLRYINKNEANAMRSTVPPNALPMMGPTFVREDEVLDTEMDCDGMGTPLEVGMDDEDTSGDPV